MHLFPDFGQACVKPAEDFANLLNARLSAELQRQDAERQRIRAEEQARAEREAKAKEDAERERIRAEEKTNTTTEGKPATPAGAGPEPARQVADIRATVFDHQDEISGFLSTRDFKDEPRIRAILVEFVKYQAGRQERKVA
jgi:hypothetical protein